MLSGVSQAQLFLCRWVTALVWSELDSVAYTESRSYLVDHCALCSVHIVGERLSASAESRETVDPADSSGSPGESGPVGESSRASSGERARS